MEFCENCKKILIPKNNKLECSCGYKKELSAKDIENQYNFKGETLPENEIILKKDNNVTLPTKKITCCKCGGKKGYWWTVQTRSADEAPTYFIRCAKCGNTWRQSN